MFGGLSGVVVGLVFLHRIKHVFQNKGAFQLANDANLICTFFRIASILLLTYFS